MVSFIFPKNLKEKLVMMVAVLFWNQTLPENYVITVQKFPTHTPGKYPLERFSKSLTDFRPSIRKSAMHKNRIKQKVDFGDPGM